MQTAVIHYIDAGEYYTIYGVTTMIVVIALLWYFVRSNLTMKHRCVEGLNNPDGDENGDFDELGLSGVVNKYPPRLKLTKDGEEPKYNIQSGTYGDVPVVFYSDQDNLYAGEWRVPNRVYVKNTRTTFMEQVPSDKTFYDNHDQYVGVEVDGLTHLSKVVPE
jgi:hypothetical protein